MAMTINTNVSSLVTQSSLNKSSTGLATAIQRLSSGLRIKRAKDDVLVSYCSAYDYTNKRFCGSNA